MISTNTKLIAVIIATSVLAGGAIANAVGGTYFQTQFESKQSTSLKSPSLTMNGLSDSPSPVDIVTVTVHDANGKIKSQQTVHNFITSSGAVWFCVQQGRCGSEITTPTIAYTGATAPTWWVQFITGTANANEPTGADCTVSAGSLSGDTSGAGASLRCATLSGGGKQYSNAGFAIQTVGTASGNLRNAGATADTTNNFVQTTGSGTCTINDGTAPVSGTCAYTETTPQMTNNSGGSITINGLALASGSSSGTTAGPVFVAETTTATGLPVTLANGDSITVTWTITV